MSNIYTSGSSEWSSHTHTVNPTRWTHNIHWNGVEYSPTTNPVWTDTRTQWDGSISTDEARRRLQALRRPTKEKTVKNEVAGVISKRREKRIEKACDDVEKFLDSVPRKDGTVISWSTKFDSGEIDYHYVAVLAKARWYISGSQGSLTRDELMQRLVEHSMEGKVSALLVRA